MKRGVIRSPFRLNVYGDNGVGKTSLAAGAEKPIFFDIEDGSGQLDVARYMFRDDADGHVPRSYAEVCTGLDDLATNPHEFKTLVIDTLDRLEALIWAHMCARDSGQAGVKGRKLNSIEDYGYGKGFLMAVDEWRALCLRLDRVRARGVNIVLLSHAQIRTFKDPEGEDYDRWNLRLNEKAAGFVQEWVDINGFARFEESGESLDKGVRAKGVSTGRRLLHTQRTAAYNAKSRWAIPAELELPSEEPWRVFAAALQEAQGLGALELVDLIAAECNRIASDETTAKVKAAMAGHETNVEVLHRILNRLREKK